VDAHVEVIDERCWAWTVHQRTVVACLLTPDLEGERRQKT
jgi:hypothetical protein